MYISKTRILLILALVFVLLLGGIVFRDSFTYDAKPPEDTNNAPADKKEPIVEETGRERGGCIISGCSGQVCGENDVVTTCEFQPEYACYENTVCERQADGQCGWTLTAAVGRCLQDIKR